MNPSGHPTASPPGDLNGRLRVLLVDDHPFLRRVVAEFLEAEPDLSVVGEAATGREALTLVNELHPDIVLMDVNLPEMNGVEATRRIRQSHPSISVVGLSMHIEAPVADAMREAGASGYVPKDAAPDTLLQTIRDARPV